MLLVVNVMYELIFSIVNAKKSTLLGGKRDKVKRVCMKYEIGATVKNVAK